MIVLTGNYCPDGVNQYTCGPGTYSTGGASSCSGVPAGYYANAYSGATGYSCCGAGSYSPGSDYQCYTCVAGTYSGDCYSYCQSTPAGIFLLFCFL